MGKTKKHLNEFMADFSSNAGNAQPAMPQQQQKPQPQQQQRIPKSGDPAYSKYHGSSAEGVLQQREGLRDGLFELIVKGRNPWFSDPNQHLSVGSDEPIKWDSKRNMWYAPANYD